MPRKSLTDSDSFRFICDEFTLKAQREEPTPFIRKKANHLCKSWRRHKTWAPWKCCTRCGRYLGGRLTGTHSPMPFAIPMEYLSLKES